MDVTKAIQTRQAVRDFAPAPVAADQIDALLDAAGYAPVARGRFNEYLLTAVDDPKLIDELEVTDSGHPFYGAPAVIFVSTTADNQAGYVSAGMIAATIELKATELGLETCTIMGILKMGIEKSPEAMNLLGLPEGYKPAVAVALGQSKKPVSERHFVTPRIRTVKIGAPKAGE